MRGGPLAVVSLSLLLGLAARAEAQQSFLFEPADAGAPSVALSADHARQLDLWLSAMEKWQRYAARWHNRPVHNGWGGIGEREPRPEPPGWLAAHCDAAAAARVLDLEVRMATACRLLDDPASPMKAVPTPAQAA